MRWDRSGVGFAFHCRAASVWVLAVVLIAVRGGAAMSGPNPRPAGSDAEPKSPTPSRSEDEPYRSPIALALSSDGSRLLTANQSSNSVSLIDPRSGRVLHEIATGDKPAGVAWTKDGAGGAVAHWYGYDLAILAIENDKLRIAGRVEVGPEPRGVAIAPDGASAFVAVGASNEVVRVDLKAAKVTGRLTVGREPRGLAITADGRRLLVGNSRDETMSVIDVDGWKVERSVRMQGVNLRQVAIGPDGKFGYATNMKNRGFATTRTNIDLGWVLGQRLTRIALDGSEPFETLSLDPQGEAAGDAHGVAISPDGKTYAVSCGGTHEVMLFREPSGRLPWRTSGSRDTMNEALVKDAQRFQRFKLGGRPTELAFAPDGKTLYVANYFADAVQVLEVGPDSVKLASSIPLAGGETKPLSLARRGEMVFHDAERSFNQWYSCNTCHSDGHTNGQNFDTMNDGWHDYSTIPKFSKKKIPTLRGVARTGPWTWHGWQTSLYNAMAESFTKSMQGPQPPREDVLAILAFLETLESPRNPHRQPDNALSPAAARGREVFRSAKAACNTCHGGSELTDGKIHEVGLEERRDVYKGYNPPSLVGIYDKDPYLHDGRAKTLKDALTGAHDPDEVTGLGALTELEIEDLLAYLKTL